MATTHVVVRAGSEQTVCGHMVSPTMGLTFAPPKATCPKCKRQPGRPTR